jgi:hypothetical protein
MIPDTSSFITEIPSEYITETELNEAIANIDIPESGGGSAEGAVSYLEAQELTNEQKNTAKNNLGLPYVVSEQLKVVENKSVGAGSGPNSVYIYTDTKALKALPTGSKFTITVADAATNPTFTETIECSIRTATGSVTILTDTTNLVFFDSWSSPYIDSGNISFYKKDTTSKGLPYYLYYTILAGETEVANVLDSRLVDLSNYCTKKEAQAMFNNIKTAEGGAY